MKGVHIPTPLHAIYFASNKLSTKTSTWGLSSSGM